MKLKLLYFFVLIFGLNAFSQHVIHNEDGCRKMIFISENNGTYTSIVANPDTSSGNTVDYTNTNVSLISPSSVNSNNSQAIFKLPVVIEKGVDFDWSLKVYSANSGSNNTGSGRLLIRLFNSVQGNAAAGDRWQIASVDKTGGWQEISVTSNIPTARSPINFDSVQIIGLNNAATGASEDFYFDDFKIDIDPVLSDTTADLDAGNIWYYNNAILGTIYTDFRVGVNESIATPTTDGNSSVNVMKVTRGGNISHQLRIHHGDIDQTAGGVIKFRVYPECTGTETTPNITFRLRKDNDDLTQYYADIIYLHEGLWNEVEITLGDLTNDGSVAAGNLYDGSLLLFNAETSGNTPPFEFYIDSFQGPQGATTWTGVTDTDWATYIIWSSYIPGSKVNAIIPVSTTSVISASTGATVNDLTVNASSSLTVESGGSLTVDGELTLESTSTTYSSLIADGTITGVVNYKRYVNEIGTTNATNNGNDLISAPVTETIGIGGGQTFGSFAAANSNLAASTTTPTIKAFAPFDNTATDPGAYVNFELGGTDDAETLDSGIGYRVGTTDGNPLTFTGTVNSGTVITPITIGSGSEWNLIGNPYPSYLIVNDGVNGFLNNATNTGLLDETSVGVYGYNANLSETS